MSTNRRITTTSAALWASAFVIAALVIVQAGRLPINPAYADQAVSENGYTLVTTDSGRGDEAAPYQLLYIIDDRTETMLVYQIEDARQKQIMLRDGGSLRGLFLEGRR
jgi:hypothetical protein